MTQKQVVDISEKTTLTENQVPKNTGSKTNIENEEILVSYVTTGKRWNRNKIVIDQIFAYAVATDLIKESENLESNLVQDCRHRNDCPKCR